MLHAAKNDAGPDLRVGVIGVGVMGSNHARVLAEMPGVRLAGVCRSRPQAGRLRRHHARMPGGQRRRRAARPRRRCGVDRGADPSASRDRARLHRARRPRAGREADRLHGRRGQGHHQRGAPRRRHPDDRPCRALQSRRPGDQGSDPRRGHPVDRDHPRRPVPAAHVECRRGDRPRRPRHRPDLLVHRVRDRRGAAAALQRGRRARGHRAPAVPHRLRRARPHQHQLAHPVQGAHRPRRDQAQIRDRRSAHPPGHRVLRLPARRQLFDAPSLGRPCRAAARRADGLREGDQGAHAAAGHRRGRRREPRGRHPVPRRPLRCGEPRQARSAPRCAYSVLAKS